MTLIQSHALIAEKAAEYKPGSIGRSVTGPFACEADDANALRDLIAHVCSRILESDPLLVADVASGRQDQAILHDRIARFAEEQSLRAGYYRLPLRQQVVDSLFGYGPLQSLIDDPLVSDIDATGPDSFTIKRKGMRSQVPVRFEDSQNFDNFCRLLIIRHGGIINENDSHCRVTDPVNRLRINVTVPPRSLNHACLSIRKHSLATPSLEELCQRGLIDRDCMELLLQLACSEKSIVICGQGASGKTTLLRSLIHVMPPLERILIAESDSEIYPEKACCLVQRIKRPQSGGRPVSLRDLISDGLTMSLDTYCVGEIVGEEAYEFIRAAYSGHRCLATVHAVSAEDAMDRLVSLARTAASAEHDQMLRRMLSRGIQIVIYLRGYKVRRIIEVNDYQDEVSQYANTILWSEASASTSVDDDQSPEPVVSGSGGSAVCF